jgi:DNA-binding NarL/FixJ family response regulator
MKTRILLYSDEPVLIKGLESVLVEAEGFDLLPACGTVANLIEQMSAGAADLVLVDLTDAISFAVLSEMKLATTAPKIVLWVNSISTELAYQAMGLGVRGVLRKTLPIDLLLKCLQKVQAGELWFEKTLTDNFLCARRVALTRREGQLVTWLSQGMKNKEIATAMLISEGTVKVYLSRLFQKVGVKDRLELALFGLKNLTPGQQPEKSSSPATAAPNLRSLVLDRTAERPQASPRFSATAPHLVQRSY